ncbi:MAG: Ldh family oxidoreductase [Alphaproteobacteria bacterium]|nr:Ldh family oxidoreductase [Alphaproteobacteria bacterium]
MARYPGAESEARVPHEVLRATVAAIFEACGMSGEGAALLADSLVHADLRGIHSHGVLRVPDYVAKLTKEGVDPRGRPRLVEDNGAALVVDCGNTMGQIGAAFAMRHAIARARTTNLALAAIRGSNHCGAMDYVAMMALAEDMIGLCGTNALPTMAPWGGTDKIVGINPLGVAIPGGVEGPFVIDTSFGMTAHGKIRVYAQKAEPIPVDWAFDADGRPATDAVAALDGLIRPIGGHKGVGLGMAIGMLASLLSGAAYGTELGNMDDGPTPGLDGHFVLAINVAAFAPVDQVKARVDAILRQVRHGNRAPGVERLFTPGEIEAELELDQRVNGIPLNSETLNGILEQGRAVGADIAALQAAIGAE